MYAGGIAKEESALRLYNTLTKHEEEFVPLKKKEVTMYTCGPTVYGRPHIGNFSSFLMADLLRRWLEAGHGYRVKHVKNITDVGHLVADRDEGEDKVEKEAKKEKVDPLAIAKKYTEQYLHDERALNILEPAERPRATETVQEMLAMVKDLLRKGNAYETHDGIYFSVETFPRYGRLSGNTIENINAGARVDIKEEKKHPADFALWKKCVGENGRHLLRWSFATGERVTGEGEDASAGFPGWHIECSAMSRKFLGDTIDIHTGGEDNIFPHHECEIAQSESVTGKPFVRFWLHKRRIDLAGEKMSKSLGNILTVPDVIAKGYSAQDLRYYLLSVHYRTNLKFAWKGMDDARKARLKIIDWMDGADSWGDVRGKEATGERPPAEEFRRQFIVAMDSDLNTPQALAVIFECMAATRNFRYLDEAFEEVEAFIGLVRAAFGCFESEEAGKIPAEILALAKERDTARAEKNFQESDRIRDALIAEGYELRDTPEGTKVKRK